MIETFLFCLTGIAILCLGLAILSERPRKIYYQTRTVFVSPAERTAARVATYYYSAPGVPR